MKSNEFKDGFNYWLYLAWLMAILATFGSLYLSEILGWTPCKLCWFQRIFMYPLTVLLGIACFRNDRQIALYVLPLSIVGGLISAYHYAEQHIQALQNQTFCGQGVSCSQKYFEAFGFITIPFLAFIAFACISLFVTIDYRNDKKQSGSRRNKL
ncbi:disulfide bond formation protein B [Terrilactibacillus sp. BCM23-1]|uniref:Probable disulfide formation protein n=1 Tax=Terrilactibacillus tamarindi TaxID=2599694 RepID=A0A6N8CSJ2_9BACI|nr:disulfide oxidoreductase [Terrilactibacillus tamarindi]MTT33152.1 disulfide bond formation protein B [Terrilactibacillus tamarindi]